MNEKKTKSILLSLPSLETIYRQLNEADDINEKLSFYEKIDNQYYLHKDTLFNQNENSEKSLLSVFFKNWKEKRNKLKSKLITRKTEIEKSKNNGTRVKSQSLKFNVIDAEKSIIEDKIIIRNTLTNIGKIQDKLLQSHEEHLEKIDHIDLELEKGKSLHFKANNELKETYKYVTKEQIGNIKSASVGTGTVIGTAALPGLGSVLGGAFGWLVGKKISKSAKNRADNQLKKI